MEQKLGQKRKAVGYFNEPKKRRIKHDHNVLPVEIWCQIFSFIPTKNLLKRVCKDWYIWNCKYIAHENVISKGEIVPDNIFDYLYSPVTIRWALLIEKALEKHPNYALGIDNWDINYYGEQYSFFFIWDLFQHAIEKEYYTTLLYLNDIYPLQMMRNECTSLRLVLEKQNLELLEVWHLITSEYISADTYLHIFLTLNAHNMDFCFFEWFFRQTDIVENDQYLYHLILSNRLDVIKHILRDVKLDRRFLSYLRSEAKKLEDKSIFRYLVANHDQLSM